VEDGLRGTYGNVQVHVRENGKELASRIDAYHPEISNATDQPPNALSCEELAASEAPQLLFINLAVVSARCNSPMSECTTRLRWTRSML